MNLTLRPARDDDHDFARALHHSVYREVVIQQFGSWDDLVQRKFFEEAWQPNESQIIQLDGKNIGCIQRRRHPDHIELVEIQLLPDYQGGGIGTSLLKDAIISAHEAGLPLRLRVLKESRAMQLYQKLGFAKTGMNDTYIFMEHKE